MFCIKNLNSEKLFFNISLKAPVDSNLLADKVRFIMSDALNLYVSDMKITKLLFKLNGLDIFSEDSKKNFMFFILIGDMILFNLSQFFSSYYFREDIPKLIFSTMTWPFGFLVSI